MADLPKSLEELVEIQEQVSADAGAIEILAAKVGGPAGNFLAGIADDLRRLEALMIVAGLWEEDELDSN